MERKRRGLWGLLLGLAAAGLYTALALVYLRPVWRLWQDHIAPVPEDPVFNLYVLKWGAHQIRLGLPGFWDANIFYPVRGALALSDHLLGPAFQLTLFELFVPNAIAGYNALFVSSFVLSALATAWVARRGGRSMAAALLAGWMFSFSPFRLQHLNHLQMLLAQWIPLTLWSWDRLLAKRTPANAARFLLLYLLHVTGGCYLAYMIHVPLLVLLLNRIAVEGKNVRALLVPRSLRVLAPVALVAAGTLAALFLPYLRTAHELGLKRNEQEIGVLAAATPSYFSPSTENLYFGTPRRGFFRTPFGAWTAPFFRTENALFAGFLPTLFGVWGFAVWLRRRGKKAGERRSPGRGRRLVLGMLLLVAAAAWAWGDLLTLTDPEDRADLPLRLGSVWENAAGGWAAPALLLAVSLGLWLVLRRRWGGPLLPAVAPDGMDGGTWERGLALSGLACCALTFPIVYVPLSRIVPGLDGMRVPARFYAFVSFTLVWFAARGVDELLRRLRSAPARAGWIHRTAACALAVLLAVELAPKPVNWVPLLREEDFPDVYRWIARQPDVRALVELPIRRNWRENVPMYYSTLHWRPIANGYSGYEPWSHQEIAERLRLLPDRAGVELLRNLGITHMIVHPEELRRYGVDPGRFMEDLDRTLASGPERLLEPVFTDEGIRVYRILHPPAVPRTG